MRKFRNAALAGMTAVTLVAGMTTSAFANDNDTTNDGTTNDNDKGSSAVVDKGSSSLNKNDVEYPGHDLDASERPEEGRNNHEGKCVHDFDLTTVDGQQDSCTTESLIVDFKNTIKNPSNSSEFGKRWNADKDVTGRNFLGLEKNFGEIPVWAQIWYVVTVLGVVGSVIGLGWLPVMNQLKNQGIIV